MRHFAAVLIVPLSLFVAVAVAWPADEPKMTGVDVVKTIEHAVDAFSSKNTPQRPWADDLAALSAAEPSVAMRGQRNLITRGAPVLPDLAELAKDRDPQVRARIAQVVMGIGSAGIGGANAASLALTLSHDREATVRELAALALGRCAGEGVYERLVELLRAPQADIRRAAARSLGALGDVRALGPLSQREQDLDDLVRRERDRATVALLQLPTAVPMLITLLPGSVGADRDALLEACATVADPRLGPVLTPLAGLALKVQAPVQDGDGISHGDPAAWTAWLALRALATNGDSRTWGTLASVAADAPHPDLRNAAAATLRTLTGYPAGPGQAWTLWWRDHAATADGLSARDAFLAELRDPARTPTRAELAAFAPAQLMPLLDAALSREPGWWPARALTILRMDEPARWRAALLARYTDNSDELERIGVIALVETLAPPDAAGLFSAFAQQLDQRDAADRAAAKAANAVPLDHGAERLALMSARGR